MSGIDWLRPGVHTSVSADDYFADPAKDPSLTASVAKLLLGRSPLHAWTSHPKLNPDYVRTEEQRFDIGTVVHALLLEGEEIVQVVEANDWRTKKAQEERDQARADGLVPLLAKDWGRVQKMTAAVRAQLAARGDDPPLLTAGKPEQTLIWHDQGVTCRARVDWLRNDYTAIDDIKTAGNTADPHEWCRNTLWSIGADLQVAMNRRGVKLLTGTEPAFRYLIMETAPPYAISVISLSPEALALADQKLDTAIARWRDCLERDEWPGYTQQIAYAELPPWVESRWLERQALEEMDEEAAAA